jgi:hypothetical protein
MNRLIVAHENRIVDALSRWIGQAASSSSGGAISTHHFSTAAYPSSQLSSTTSSSMPLVKGSVSLSRRGTGRERPSVSIIRHANSPRSSSDCLSILHLQRALPLCHSSTSGGWKLLSVVSSSKQMPLGRSSTPPSPKSCHFTSGQTPSQGANTVSLTSHS